MSNKKIINKQNSIQKDEYGRDFSTLEQIINHAKPQYSTKQEVLDELDIFQVFISSDDRIIVWVSYYDEKDKTRQMELQTSIMNNCNNRFIDKVCVLDESKAWFPFEHNKMSKIRMTHRLDFHNMFKIVNNYSNPNDINIFCNSDIIFDDTIINLKKINWTSKKFVTLSRWDINEDDTITFRNRADSQDVWIWKGYFSEFNEIGNYNIGIAGCDNRLLHELYNKCRRDVINPGKSIMARHLHKTDVRNYKQGDLTKRLPKPYGYIKPCELFAEDTIDVINKEKTKNIIHMGLNYRNQTNFVQAMSNLGNLFYLNWKIVSKLIGKEETIKKIKKKVDQIQPDLIFMQVQNNQFLTIQDIKEFSELSPNCKIVNWTGDVREPLSQWWYDVGKLKNVITCFTNWKNVRDLRQEGIDSYYLQIGYEKSTYNKNGSVSNNTQPIVFMGNNYFDRFPLSVERAKMVYRLKREFGKDFGVYGTNWGEIGKSLMENPEAEAEMYRSCKISIGINHYDLDRYDSDRLFRAMGCGAFYLNKKHTGIFKDFQDSKHLVVWDTIDDLIEKIKYYLNHDGERQAIARLGNEFVEEKHTWENRIKTLKGILSWD